MLFVLPSCGNLKNTKLKKTKKTINVKCKQEIYRILSVKLKIMSHILYVMQICDLNLKTA